MHLMADLQSCSSFVWEDQFSLDDSDIKILQKSSWLLFLDLREYKTADNKRSITDFVRKTSDIVTGRPGRPWLPPPPKYSNKARSKNFSFRHQGYCYIRMFRNYTGQKFPNFYRLWYNFWTIYGCFSFFLIT